MPPPRDLARNRLVAVALAAGVATDGRRFVPPVPWPSQEGGVQEMGRERPRSSSEPAAPRPERVAHAPASVTHLVRDISVQIAV